MDYKAKEQERIASGYQLNVETKRQKRDGVVVTPINVIDFQLKSSILSIKLQYGIEPDDAEWLDPFGGTGVYIARLLQIVNLSKQRKLTLAKKCIVLEIDHEVCQIAANNLSIVHEQETGCKGDIRVLCVDTFSHDPDTNWFDSTYDDHLVLPKFPHPLF